MRGLEGKNREAAATLRKLDIKIVELDVSDDASVAAGVEKVLAEAGKIDVLINNAGIGSAGVTEAFTAEQAKAIFDTNVIGLLRVSRAVLPSMRERRDGLIINISSILGRVTFPFLGIYGASKFAVEARHSDPGPHRSSGVLRRGRPHPRRLVHLLNSDVRGRGRPQSARRRGGNRRARRSSQGQPRCPHRRRCAVRLRPGQ
jgi:NADP-dependent 3-hydroxy acid dehydrogenase YdfG